MAKIYGQLEKAQMENTTSDAGSQPKGMITYRTDINQVKVSNGTTYKALIDEDSAQPISNKDIDGGTASNTTRVTIPKNTLANLQALTRKEGTILYATDTDKFYKDDGSTLSEIGSGSSGVNYIIDNDGSAIGSWVTFDDGAVSTPVDGTGGTPGVTYAVSTNSSMRGTSNFLFTHDAADRQGEGFSYSFSIDPSDKGKVLQISLEYLIAGTYASDDLQFWIYDVTNAALIQPAPFKLKNSGIIEKFAMEFQTSSSSTSYRLIGMVTTTTATAYTVRFDNWNLGPQAKLYGSPVTDWVSYTPIVSNSTGTNTGKWRRVGDSMEITGKQALTGDWTGNPYTSVPTGYSIDTTKLPATNSMVGTARYIDASDGDKAYSGVVYVSSSTTFIPMGPTHSYWAASVPVATASGDLYEWNVTVPIVGWSSSVIMSSDANTNVITSRQYTTTHSNAYTMNNSYVKVTFDTTIFDTTGSFDAVTNKRYNVPTPGFYRITTRLRSANTPFLNSTYEAAIFKNGVFDTSIASDNPAASNPITLSGSSVLQLVAGDYIEIYLYGAGNNSSSAITLNSTNLYIEKVSGPAQIAASETVSARYTTAAGQSIPNNSNTVIDFGTKDFDYTGSVTTGASWKFTAPISGL